MSKVIAILNEPINCLECEFGYANTFCGKFHNRLTDTKTFDELEEFSIHKYKRNKTKPEWCPLKPVPEKAESEELFDEYDDGYVDGWNSCIDEILKIKREDKNAKSN